jgi:ribosomal protein L44E
MNREAYCPKCPKIIQNLCVDQVKEVPISLCHQPQKLKRRLEAEVGRMVREEYEKAA